MFALNVAHCTTFGKLTKLLGGCLTAIEDDVHVDLMGGKSAKWLLSIGANANVYQGLRVVQPSSMRNKESIKCRNTQDVSLHVLE